MYNEDIKTKGESAQKYNIQKIYIAMPSATAEERRDIINICKETGCDLKNLPGIYQMVNENVNVGQLKNVSIDDLLGKANAVSELVELAQSVVTTNPLKAIENGVKLAEHFAETTRASVMVIAPQKNADELSDLLNSRGVMVIAKPVNKHLFHHYLLFSDCFRSRLLRVEQENERLRHMVEDLKIIDRAKLLLVTCLNMSEEQAHRYLEKQAMDLRTTRLAVAKQVIQTYEN